MEHFDHSVAHDQREIIPLLRAALSTSASSSASAALRLVASPWSPPGWMKVSTANRETEIETETEVKTDAESGRADPPPLPMTMTGSNTPNGLIPSPEVMAAWALYISYFIDAYAMLDIPIWAVTPQNEPEFPAPWEACSYNASFERAFIDGFLGPQLRKAHPKVCILTCAVLCFAVFCQKEYRAIYLKSIKYMCNSFIYWIVNSFVD